MNNCLNIDISECVISLKINKMKLIPAIFRRMNEYLFFIATEKDIYGK